MLEATAHPELVPPRRPGPEGLFCREQADLSGGKPSAVESDQEEPDQKSERPLRCIVCKNGVTTGRERFSKGGKHLHTFFNPAGIVYEIGCFRRASGCVASGAPSSEFSWFSGYSWRVAYCRQCFEHLGWHFSGSGDRFFGLIVNRLLED